MTTVCEMVVEILEERGTRALFGLMGAGNMAIIERMLARGRIAYHAVAHENAAVAMADGYARMSGTVGVASVSEGPALTNALTALVEANKSHTPLVLVTGEIPIDLAPNTRPGTNQYLDQESLCRSLSLGFEHLVDPASTRATVRRAFHRAERERRPVVVSISTEIEYETIDASESDGSPESVEAASIPDHALIAQVVEHLQSAERPLIVAGRAVLGSDSARSLAELAGLCGALVGTSAVAKGLFEDDPYCLGILGGFSLPTTVEIASEADLVLGFGLSFNSWTTRFGELFSKATVVHCDDRPAAIGANQPVDVALVGDVAITANALLEEAKHRGLQRVGWRRREIAEQIAHDGRDEAPPLRVRSGYLDPRALLVRLDAILPINRIVCTDSGLYMRYAARHLRVGEPGGFVFAQAFMSVGLGLATAGGASIARPDCLTVAVIGDGGLRMSLGELETVAQVGSPLLVVLMNDGAYGVEFHLLEDAGHSTAGSTFVDRDFAGIASLLGMKGQTVASLDDLEAASKWIDDPTVPLLLDCKLDRSVMRVGGD